MMDAGFNPYEPNPKLSGRPPIYYFDSSKAAKADDLGGIYSLSTPMNTENMQILRSCVFWAAAAATALVKNPELVGKILGTGGPVGQELMEEIKLGTLVELDKLNKSIYPEKDFAFCALIQLDTKQKFIEKYAEELKAIDAREQKLARSDIDHRFLEVLRTYSLRNLQNKDNIGDSNKKIRELKKQGTAKNDKIMSTFDRVNGTSTANVQSDEENIMFLPHQKGHWVH
jgi:hypothetical protein